ncbi:MAG: prolyl aminopeptidase [Pseudomonadota bacterium]
MFDLFPEIEPYHSGFLEVDDTHEIYWEECGNPDGVPVVYLHGGPGGKCTPKNRRYFDPDHYRIILFDQRGAGQSKPSVCLDNNSPDHLVEDIEALRNFFEIDKWHIFGGSWGSTLSLFYACKYPECCLSLTLRGIFLMEQSDIDWLYDQNKNVFPEAWEEFAYFIPENERDDLIGAYYKRLTGDNEKEKRKAALSWALYESACASLIPNYEIVTTEQQIADAVAIATIEAHFFHNYILSPENSILNQVDQLKNIPATIVHGRYDMICPIIQAHKLHQKWPEAEFIVVPDAGHSSSEPGILSHLIEATEKMKSIKG